MSLLAPFFPRKIWETEMSARSTARLFLMTTLYRIAQQDMILAQTSTNLVIFVPGRTS